MSRLLITVLLSLLQACATSVEKTANMRNFMELSRYDLALIEAENQLAKYQQGVMENMNAGILRRLNKDYKGSNKAFEQAKKKIEEFYATSVSEQASAFFINDELISFQGEKFEQALIHLYMASNYLNLSEPDSARVELLQFQVRMDEWSEPKDEVPFMRYFSGILYELLNEEDSATVAYRKAVDAYSITKEKHGLDIPRQLKFDLLRLLAKMHLWDEYAVYQKQFGLKKVKLPEEENKGELIVILGNGMAPPRSQRVFQTWAPDLSLNIRVAVPAYPNPPVVLNRVRLNIAGEYYPLETVSNIDGLARAALDEDMAGITARAISRAVIKKKTERQMGKENGVVGQLALMVFNQGTEIADTRSWNTLPQEFALARVFLSPGEYTALLEIISPTGQLVDVIQTPVTVIDGGKAVINERWTAAKYVQKKPRQSDIKAIPQKSEPHEAASQEQLYAPL